MQQAKQKATSRVLLVEDEPVLREMLRRQLDCLGYEVVAAANGQEAWEMFRLSEFLRLFQVFSDCNA